MLGRATAEPFETFQLRGLKVVEVGDIAHQPGVVELPGGLLAYPLDIHHLAAHEMLHTSGNLRRTVELVGALPCGLPLNTHKRRTARRAVTNELNRPRTRLTLRRVDTRNLGNNLTTLLNVEHIALMYAEPLDNIFIMERRALYNRARKEHRLKIGHRCDDAHATHLERNEAQTCQRPFGGELIGHGPARRLGRIAQI